jgi:hypothetical protein
MLLTAALAISSCSQPGHSTHSGQPGNGGRQPATGSGPFGGKTPTGTQLGSLLTHARLPAGWGPGANSSPEDDSGPWVSEPAGPASGEDSCPELGPGVSALDFIGWWSVSDATLIVVQNNPSSSDFLSPMMNLTIGAYQPADDASRTLSAVTGLVATCTSFTDFSGDSGTVSAAAPHLGSQSLYLTSTVQTSNVGPIVDQVLLARVGNYVIGVDTSTATSSPISRSTLEEFGASLAGLV